MTIGQRRQRPPSRDAETEAHEVDLGDDAFGQRAARGADFSTYQGALRLKEMIESYWRERGRHVMVALENAGFHPAIRAARYEIRSDMINGLPSSKEGSPRSPEDD